MPEVIGPVRPAGDFPVSYMEEIESRTSRVPLAERVAIHDDLAESIIKRLPSRALRFMLEQWIVNGLVTQTTRDDARTVGIRGEVHAWSPNGVDLDANPVFINAMTRNSTHLFVAVNRRVSDNPGLPTYTQSHTIAILAITIATRALDRTQSWVFAPPKQGFSVNPTVDDFGAKPALAATDDMLWISQAGDTGRMQAYSLDPNLIWDGFTGVAREPNRVEASDIIFTNLSSDAHAIDGAQLVDDRLWVLHNNVLYITSEGFRNITVPADGSTPYEYRHFLLSGHQYAGRPQRYIDFYYNERDDVLFLLAVAATAAQNAFHDERVIPIPNFLHEHADPRRTGTAVAQPDPSSGHTFTTDYAKGIVGDDAVEGGVLWFSRGVGIFQELEAYHPVGGTFRESNLVVEPRPTLDIVRRTDHDRERSYILNLGHLPAGQTGGSGFSKDVTDQLVALGHWGNSAAALRGKHFVVEDYFIRVINVPAEHNGIALDDVFKVDMWSPVDGAKCFRDGDRIYVSVPPRPYNLYPSSKDGSPANAYTIGALYDSDTAVFGRRVQDWDLFVRVREIILPAAQGRS